MNKKVLSTKLLHCFGSRETIKVTPQMAAQMIIASEIKEIPINTHNIDIIKDWKDLPIGYGNASWNTLSNYLDLSNYKPLWNINLPQNAKEAVDRVKKVIDLGGNRPVKFEVLDSTLKWSNNEEVIKAVKKLVAKNIEIWPLIAPDYNDFLTLQNLGCPLIRIMGSPISSNNGITSKYIPVINQIITNKNCQIMLDGGVGSLNTVKQAINVGFDHVLVNSWLFSDNNDPIELLKSIKKAIEEK